MGRSLRCLVPEVSVRAGEGQMHSKEISTFLETLRPHQGDEMLFCGKETVTQGEGGGGLFAQSVGVGCGGMVQGSRVTNETN